MIKQRTIKSITQAAGVGLHTGQKVYMTLRPAQPDTGIVFCRNDLPTPMTVKADAFKVGDTRLSTCLEGNGVKVSTIEHLMSALAGLGIDNLYVDLTATEVPIVDGSAAPFVFLLQAAGIEEQAVAKRYVRVKKAIEVHDGDKWVRLEPHRGFKLTYTIAYNHPVFANVPDSVTVDFADTSYVNQVARARTFGFMQEVEALLAQGLAQGGSLDNAIVMDEYRVINDDGLRYHDEFVRHKILDAIGDLYLLGHPLVGAFHGYKSGHALNNALLRTLLADEQAWEFVTFEAPETVPAAFLARRLETA